MADVPKIDDGVSLLHASERIGVKQTELLPGIELPHVQPGQFKELAQEVRRLCALIAVGHGGETIVEPVAPRYLAAIERDRGVGALRVYHRGGGYGWPKLWGSCWSFQEAMGHGQDGGPGCRGDGGGV